MARWLLQFHFINSIGSISITKYDANCDSKIKSSNHVCNNSASRHSIFLQIHDSKNFWHHEGVNILSEGVTKVLLENKLTRLFALIDGIHYICLFNSGC